EEAGQPGNIKVPAIGRTEVHQTEGPKVGVTQQPQPGDAAVGCLGRPFLAVDEGELGRIDAFLLVGAITEPPPEQATPEDPQATEDPERVPPGHRLFRAGAGFDNQGQDEQRGNAPGETPGHPDGPLRESAFPEGKPVVESAGNVRICPGLAYTEQEANREHG